MVRALPPHDSIKQILLEGQSGTLERPLIRAMLDRISVFPIGSHVELSDGITARVVRATPGQHTRPVVHLLDASGEPIGDTIDLAQDQQLRVVRSLASPKIPAPA